jgi:hypothetical protein
VGYSNLQKLARNSPIEINFEDLKRKETFPKPEPILPHLRKLRVHEFKEEAQ